MHYIHENIKFYRTHNRFTQQEVADKFEVTLGMLKTYERADAVPPVEVLMRIADVMRITIDTLIKVKLTPKNYLKVKGEGAPDLLQRVEALEFTVNKTVNKITKKQKV